MIHLLRHIFKQQITKLHLMNKDCELAIRSLKDYTNKVYAHILTYFENLEYLNVIETPIHAYPALLIDSLLSTTFSSLTLTYLCINVANFNDCLYLLDGRLKQLSTLIVKFYRMDTDSSIIHKLVGMFYLFLKLLKEQMSAMSWGQLGSL
jgi:hypothetical protein